MIGFIYSRYREKEVWQNRPFENSGLMDDNDNVCIIEKAHIMQP